MTDTAYQARYPKTVKLSDDAAIEVRLMTREDREHVLAFARSLPQSDLLFLRVDLTEPDVVDNWIENLEAGLSTSLVAFDDSGMIGYATVHRNPAPWTRRVGEIRVNVSQDYRARGVGRILISEIFDLAREIGIKKLMANMTPDQHGAQAAFRRLGFVPEAVLADYVEDRNGTSRDLLIMSHDVEGHTDSAGNVARI